MALPAPTEAIIRQHAAGDSFLRGQAYYDEGAVQALIRRGNVLDAQVQGSDLKQYHVRCTWDEAGISEATCTCLYAYGGWCKHIVAVLLAVMHGDPMEERPPLEVLLADLDHDRLQNLVLRLAQRDPDLIEDIEREIQRGDVTGSPPAPHRPPDLNAVRRQMITALHHPPEPNERGWYYFHLGSEAYELLEQAWALIRAGEGRIALDILNAMTDECLENWQAIMEDEEGETLSYVQEELGPAWTEAILSANLTPSEREGWEAKLDAWESDLGEYAGSESFEVALKALEEGWDTPELQRILQGGSVERMFALGEDYNGLRIREQLTIARLNVLERQGRIDEFLNLARAEGQGARYTIMLVRQGQAFAAAEYGMAHLQSTEDALALAQALREAGQITDALRVAERGLNLDGRKAPLGTWLADLAAALGHPELAQHAATVAFGEEKNLAAYLRVQELAGEDWPARREQLLSALRETHDFHLEGPVDIFLHEGLVDDGISLLNRSSYPSPHLIHRVAGAAVEANPDWVIQASRKQAEAIMDAGKSTAYSEAADWLATAKRAYIVAGREGDWQDYLADLLEQHRRKYKLVPLLRALS